MNHHFPEGNFAALRRGGPVDGLYDLVNQEFILSDGDQNRGGNYPEFPRNDLTREEREEIDAYDHFIGPYDRGVPVSGEKEIPPPDAEVWEK